MEQNIKVLRVVEIKGTDVSIKLALVSRFENDYVVAIDYDEEKQEWAHGHYFNNDFDAANKFLIETITDILD